MINTYKIYTDMPVSLGETSAKKPAEILGRFHKALQKTVANKITAPQTTR